jgi:hypothetical protein
MSDQEPHIRELAYRLWEEAGCPDGRNDDFWHAARELIAAQAAESAEAAEAEAAEPAPPAAAAESPAPATAAKARPAPAKASAIAADRPTAMARPSPATPARKPAPKKP